MALTKFYHGTYSDLSSKSYEEGSLYFAFPDSQTFSGGRVYIDKDGLRKEISSTYNDSPILARIAKLESLVLLHNTGISLPSSYSILPTAQETIYATFIPVDSTDDIIWTSSNENILRIDSQIDDWRSYIHGVTVTAVSSGTATLTATSGLNSASCTVEVLAGYYQEHIVVENYSPNGTAFSYQIPIGLEDGQWIEVSINISGITTIKENILSFGEDIGTPTTTTGYNLHCNTSQTQNQIQHLLRFYLTINKSSKSGIEIPITPQSGNLIFKLNSQGLWINDELVVLDNDGGYLQNIIDHFRTMSSFEVGSREGTTRSHGVYNYIKYYTFEEL